MSRTTREVVLSEALRAKVAEVPVGDPGTYQEIVNQIQARLDGTTLTVDDDLVEQIEHFGYDHGRGPWQLFLRDILAEIEASPSKP